MAGAGGVARAVAFGLERVDAKCISPGCGIQPSVMAPVVTMRRSGMTSSTTPRYSCRSPSGDCMTMSARPPGRRS